MGKLITTFGDRPSKEAVFTLGSAQYRIRVYWRARLFGWYLDLLALDGSALMSGRRLSPGYSPTLAIHVEGEPAGRLFVTGPDPYSRSMLDDGVVQLLYYEPSEVVSPPSADPLTVTPSP